MDKPNQFRSSEFHMDIGDILHMIIKGESGSAINIELMGVGSSVPEDYGGDLLQDYDGNEYTEITIGNQKWLVENLIVTHYADGTVIPEVQNAAAWTADVAGAYCWYNNDGVTYADYGLLYNGYAIHNPRGLAYLTRGGVQEAGWRVPTEEDWAELASYLGGDYNAGTKLKETGTTHWTAPNTYASNISGFTALGGSGRAVSGVFSGINVWAFFAGGDHDSDEYHIAYLLYTSSVLTNNTTATSKAFGASVRLVKPLGATITTYILAGTSVNGLILRSVDNGVSFANQGSAGYGNPTCFCELGNEDILYGTDNGYVVNYTQNTQILVEESSITAIGTDNTTVWVASSEGQIYDSTDNGVSFNPADDLDLNSTTHAIIAIGTGDILIFGDTDGITDVDGNPIQAGSFLCAILASSGDLYAGDTSGHIWESTDDGVTWVDLGLVSGGGSILSMVEANSNRIIIYAEGESIFYTDDYFATPATAVLDITNDCHALLHIGSGMCIAGDETGDIHRSIDNGANWTEISGNPQASESAINCLIYID